MQEENFLSSENLGSTFHQLAQSIGSLAHIHRVQENPRVSGCLRNKLYNILNMYFYSAWQFE